MVPLGHVVRELFAERTRVLLTILAIAWGTASITTMLALGEGLLGCADGFFDNRDVRHADIGLRCCAD